MSSGAGREPKIRKSPWHAPDPQIESVLFVAVQAVMFVCVALVAAQALAAA